MDGVLWTGGNNKNTRRRRFYAQRNEMPFGSDAPCVVPRNTVLDGTPVQFGLIKLASHVSSRLQCLKKRHPFYICYNLIRCHPILSILGRNILQEIWNKHKCTGNHISFRVFVLYRVKSSNDFYGIQ